MYRHNRARSNRISPYGRVVNRRTRNARALGRGNIFPRRARVDQFAIEPWSVCSHLAYRNANEYRDKEVTKHNNNLRVAHPGRDILTLHYVTFHRKCRPVAFHHGRFMKTGNANCPDLRMPRIVKRLFEFA